MIPVDEALARVCAAARPLEAERLALREACGRVLAAPVHSRHDLPRFAQSAVDGYAVRHADVVSAPVDLPVAGEVPAVRHAVEPCLAAGSAVRIFTGGMLPAGADTVVRQELTTRDDRGRVRILEPVPHAADVRSAGEELRAGDRLAEAGTVLNPGLVGALAAAGVHTVPVHRQPRIVVLITGDEVVAQGGAVGMGQIEDANGPLVDAQLRQWGCPPWRIGYVADEAEAVADAIARAFAEADVVVTTGGVSVGDYDFIPSVTESLGAQRLLWKVAQKPGMPLYVASRDDRLLFGLPGNPASVLTNLHVYLRAALDAMAGLDPQARWCHGLPVTAPKRVPGKTFWMRAVATTDERGQVRLRALGGQASHMLGNTAQANALVRVPEQGREGDPLRWLAL